MMSNCFTCIKPLKVKSEKRKDCSVCENCFYDRRKTVSNCDVELSGLDKSLLTKLYYQNYIMYSKDEFDQLDFEGLSHKEIFLLNESEKFCKESERFRNAFIVQLCKQKQLIYLNVITDKYVDAFVTYGMINKESDKEFFKDIVERFTNN